MRAGPSIAVLCTGPSLQRFLAAPRPMHDVYIGVNRAVVAFPCDWWAFNDHPAFTRFKPMGRPRCFTSNQAFKLITPRDRVDEFEWLFYAQINTSCPSSPVGWTNFSLTVAMVLAEHLGAGRITLYGVDWEGNADWDGPPPTSVRRTPYRWQNEQHKHGHVAGWLERQDVELVRVTAADYDQSLR